MKRFDKWLIAIIPEFWLSTLKFEIEKAETQFRKQLGPSSKSVDRPSTECRPITDRYIGQVSTNYRRSVGEVLVNEKLYQPRHIWNDYRPCLDRVSTHYRPTIDRLSTAISTDCRPSIDRVSTEYRPTIDRLSTDYRPLYRPAVDRYIDRYIDRYLGRHYPQ